MTYISPELAGHNVLYKGKRYWVIEVDAEHPFEWMDSETAHYAVYDKFMRCIIATVEVQEDDKLWVQMATQSDSGFLADDLRNAAQGAGRQDAYMSRMGWG